MLPTIVCRSRETANRVKCATNLKQVGTALLGYSNAHRGRYPQTTHDPSTPVTTQYTGWQSADPFGPIGPKANDVTAALFLLVRTGGGLPTKTFICPSNRAARAWDFNGGSATSVSNFQHRGGLTYGYSNPYPPMNTWASYRYRAAIDAEFALAADMSPGGAALPTLITTDSHRRMKLGNSPNHDGDGQNVLFGDGHVEFLLNPLVGVNRDNIFTAAGGAVVAGQPFPTSPVNADDSVILPTAPDGPVPPRPPLSTATWVWIVVSGLLLVLIVASTPRMGARLSNGRAVQ